jgi:ABC-type Mn2+/Zn2+ transport system permease subunit
MELLGERFVQNAMLASVMIGALCAFIGVYVILKRIAFVGVAISEISALGVAAGLMIGFDPTASAVALAAAAAAAFWYFGGDRSVPREGIVAYSYVLAAALAVILIAENPAAEARGIDLLSGNLLFVSSRDLVLVGIVTGIVLAIHIVLARTFLFVSFDRETAAAHGLHAGFYDFLMYLTVGVSAAVSMKFAGVLFVIGSLVAPPLAAMLIARKTGGLILSSVLFAVVSCAAGVPLSIVLDWPTAPTIVLVMCAIVPAAAAARRALR